MVPAVCEWQGMITTRYATRSPDLRDADTERDANTEADKNYDIASRDNLPGRHTLAAPNPPIYQESKKRTL